MAPLAFGKSVFTKAAAAAAGGAEFGFVTGTHGDPNVSGHGSMRCRANAGSTKFSDSADFSIVLWFRALLGDFGSGREFAMLMQGTTSSDPIRDIELFMNSKRDGDNDSNNHSINLFCKYSGGSRTVSTFGTSNDYFGSGNSTWDSDVLDGSWHCVMVRFATATANRQLYLDSVDVKRSPSTGSGGDVTGTIDLSADSYAGGTPATDTGGSDNGLTFNFSHFQGAFTNAGGAFDIGPVWIYDSGINFASASVRAHYYNDSNTDGYVTAGSDGESGGAAEAELFMTTDGSSMSNGGRLGTVTFHSVGGTVTQTASSAGPGSGDQRTVDNT